MICKCGGTGFFTEESGNSTGLYCDSCGKWQKWLNKDERRLWKHRKRNESIPEMRDATNEELNGVNEYLKGISEKALTLKQVLEKIQSKVFEQDGTKVVALDELEKVFK